MKPSAGYSGTPLAKKLGIKAGERLALLAAPDGFIRLLGALPDGVRIVTHARGGPGRIILFATSRSDLSRRFAPAARGLAEGGALWIGWPKKASGVPTDLTEDVVREIGLPLGLVDYKVCAIDGTWSGLCFARRKNS